MRRVLPTILCTLATGAFARVAIADQFDALNVNVSQSVTYDANLFRVSDSAVPPPALGGKKSDIVTVSSIGLRFDKPYAQQRFQLNISENIYRYSNFSFLDFEALNYSGAWLWHLTPRISGVLSADRTKSLVPFEDNRGFQQAIRTIENRRFTLDGLVGGPWHVLAGASQFTAEDSRIVTDEQAYSAVSAEAGVKYLATSGSSVSVVRRRFTGDYQQSRLDPIRFFDNAFREEQTEATALWIASGRSTLTGRIAWVERQHENFSQRDFEGLVGNVNYSWRPTGKLSFNAGVRRDLSTFWNQLFSSYRTTTAFTLGSTWQISAHMTAAANYDYLEAEHPGALTALVGPERADKQHRARVSLNWAPLRTVRVSAGLERLTRSSTEALRDFDTTIGSLTGSLTF